MKLYSSAASPFVRKVLVVLHETDQLDDVDIIPVQTSAITPDESLKNANPLAKIPALVRGNGSTIYDSRVICAYLDHRVSSGLYGRSWDTKVLEATADGIMEAAVLMTYERRLRPDDMVFEPWLKAQLGKVLSACSVLNDRWMAHLNGPLDMGQIAVGCALAYLDFRHPDAHWRHGNAELAEWFAAFESRPSMQATMPPEA